jgi:hypothetical protein
LPKPTLDASGIAEYIHFECCPKYFKLRFEGDEEKKDRSWAEAFKPISPLLYGSGERLEERKWNKLRARVDKYYDLREIKPDEIGWEESWKRSIIAFQFGRLSMFYVRCFCCFLLHVLPKFVFGYALP